MASAGESGSPLLYSDFQCIGCSKSSPTANSSISGDTAAQVSGRGEVQFAVLGLLRNHRNSGQGLRQRDVADYAGIDRSTYVHYEEYGKDLYPPEHMEKIAQLFEVPVETLLDMNLVGPNSARNI
ncbi:MAG: helix-turn-helix transcriptional regulator [Oscillibacter sp.]|nr:helix-turn-helix transcriptional regulator [Oscillibacter sp.]